MPELLALTGRVLKNQPVSDTILLPAYLVCGSDAWGLAVFDAANRSGLFSSLTVTGLVIMVK